MTNARERYEAKTKVVTFRVNHELYGELKRIQVESGLSFADFVKLGAGIARDEITTKIAEMNGLEGNLERPRETVQTEKKRVADITAKERQEQHEKLEHEIQAFRLFDLGWSIEEARLKLGMSQAEGSRRFTDWAAMRGEKEKIHNELLKKCLKRHITALHEQILWRATGRALEEAKIQLKHCRQMLMDQSKLTEEEISFLLAEYSNLV